MKMTAGRQKEMRATISGPRQIPYLVYVGGSECGPKHPNMSGHHSGFSVILSGVCSSGSSAFCCFFTHTVLSINSNFHISSITLELIRCTVVHTS